MALRRPTYTKPLPPDAEIFARAGEPTARWTGRGGRVRTAPVITGRDGQQRIRLVSAKYTTTYRDGQGVVRHRSTGCRQRQAAEQVQARVVGRAELVRAGVITATQDAIADHARTPLATHVAEYIASLATTATPGHVETTRSRLVRLAAECAFARLADLHADPLERWLADHRRAGMSARCANAWLSTAKAFGAWCVLHGRYATNPFAKIGRANEQADRRRQRRALTGAELQRLLAVAQQRPLAEYGREIVRLAEDPAQPKRSNWRRAALTHATLAACVERARVALAKNATLIARLERCGRERALIYKTLVLTGLRRGELASLTVGQVEMDRLAYVVLEAEDAKNRQQADVPIRADLAADLRDWLADVLAERQAAAAGPIPARLPADLPLFGVPRQLVRILDRDLAAAGIPKRDDRGRTVDVHALRHTFGTHLSKGGVALRTAQAAMRHSDPKLTANVYTDPQLLDVAGALDALPSLPLESLRESLRGIGS